MFLGGVASWFGYNEYQVAQGTTSEPQEVCLQYLESGNAIDNNHVKIGPHFADIYNCVYETRDKKEERVDKLYYGIVSETNHYISDIQDLEDKWGNLENVPEDVEWPAMDQVAVLVKTKRYTNINDVPCDVLPQESLQGLVINSIEGLDKEERKLLNECFPGVDLDKIVILEDGREPMSVFVSIGAMALGAFVSVIGVCGMFFVSMHE
jgi:hypothetical protein